MLQTMRTEKMALNIESDMGKNLAWNAKPHHSLDLNGCLKVKIQVSSVRLNLMVNSSPGFCWHNAVPVVPQDSSGVHDYFAVMDHQPGQLYALRTANNTVTLRTLESNIVTPFGRANIGIQDVAKGAYLCVATNGMMKNFIYITIQPIGGFSQWC